jgi:hypothetical protein
VQEKYIPPMGVPSVSPWGILYDCFSYRSHIEWVTERYESLSLQNIQGFFKDEAELRALWSTPDTRKKL